jgi:hypothetical protein
MTGKRVIATYACNGEVIGTPDNKEIKRQSLAPVHASVVTTAARNPIPPICRGHIDRGVPVLPARSGLGLARRSIAPEHPRSSLAVTADSFTRSLTMCQIRA